jgi:hypothetical protein
VLATRVRLRYQDYRHSLGNVDEEKGLSWELGFLGDRVTGDVFPKAYADLDLGMALPIKHSSVWLRGSAGWGPGGDCQEPFANFYFGGFRNNWVDHGDEKRYREIEHLPRPRDQRNSAARTTASSCSSGICRPCCSAASEHPAAS